MDLNSYHFEIKPIDEPNPLLEKKVICYNQQDQEIGWLQFTGLEYDYCVRIQYLYIKPEFRQQGMGSALLNYIKKEYSAAPIYTFISPVEKE